MKKNGGHPYGWQVISPEGKPLSKILACPNRAVAEAERLEDLWQSLGYGLSVERYKPKLFSERYGYRKVLRFKSFSLEPLRRVGLIS